ncbi:uncharacterized protein [Euwallacea similis]|uniref:uncharacterized protein n=1 Tax=Euwallacea similis TaxID=1736056 RepID=UPI00345006D5
MASSGKSMRCLQMNLDRGCLAMDRIKRGVDVVLGQEPCKVDGGFIRDRSDDTFIWLAPGVAARSIFRDRGFVASELNGITLVSVYFFPNESTAELKVCLGRLEGYVSRRDSRRVLLPGNLKAKSRRFGSAVTNTYGRVLEKFLDATELVPINTGGK